MIRVLFADDHPMIASALELLLAGTDYHFVGRARTGAETLVLADTLDPDLILLDVTMPDGSGLDVLEQLRKTGARHKVVLLTAGMSDHQLAAARSLRPEGIAYKTSDPGLLLQCLDEVSHGRRWVDPDVQKQLDSVRASPSSGPPITPRERELIQLVSRGLRNRDIAERLGITEGTVKVYLHTIFEKMEVSSRTELALKAPQLLASIPDRDGGE